MYGSRGCTPSIEVPYLFALRCLGSAQLLRHRSRRDFPNACIALGAWSWLRGYKLRILEDNQSTPCPVSFDQWAYRVVAKALLEGALQRLAHRMSLSEWHNIGEAYPDAILWAEQRLPLQQGVRDVNLTNGSLMDCHNLLPAIRLIVHLLHQ